MKIRHEKELSPLIFRRKKKHIELKKELKNELLKKGFSNSQCDYIIALIENFSNSESQKEKELFTELAKLRTS